MTEKLFAGIDVGTTTTKAVIINANRETLGRFVRRSGANLASAAETAFKEALAQTGMTQDAVQAIVATGYGRKNVPFDKLCGASLGDRTGSFAHDTKTEISCHARGCYHHFSQAITIVDIGGQDNKIIKLDSQGKRTSFKMNRKCSAGTGAFLEEIAHKLDIPISDLNGLAHAASKTAQIGSYCTVFTATEVLDRIRDGEKPDDIVRGLFDSVAKRIIEMSTLDGHVIMTGGVVAFNDIVAQLLSERARIQVKIAPHPQEMGAFGAALFAQKMSHHDP